MLHLQQVYISLPQGKLPPGSPLSGLELDLHATLELNSVARFLGVKAVTFNEQLDLRQQVPLQQPSALIMEYIDISSWFWGDCSPYHRRN